jgi:hypothetical protein
LRGDRAQADDSTTAVPTPSRTISVLDQVTLDTFLPHVGEIFRVLVDDQWELRTRLTAVDRWSEASARGRPREPFSLVFHGPADSALPQRIYRVENEHLEPMELFLVPIGPDAGGMRYEAVFT